MKKDILERSIKEWTKDGVSPEDISSIRNLYRELKTTLDTVAAECEAEGYPSHGSNFALRSAYFINQCEASVDEILAKYYPDPEEE